MIQLAKRLWQRASEAQTRRRNAPREDQKPSLTDLETRRSICAERLRAAEARGDSRAIGFWLMELRQATHDALRAA